MAKQTFTTGQVLTAAQMTSLQQTAMLGGAASAKTASYTLVAADAGTAISMSNASATTITVNTALFAAGDTVQITNIGAGVCTITAGTATVNTSSSLALAQYESGTLDFTSTSAAIFIKGAGAAAASGGMTLLSTTTLSGTSTTVSSIDQTYNDLIVIINNPYINTGSTEPRIDPNGTNLISRWSGTYNSATYHDDTLYVPFYLPTASETKNSLALVIHQYANSSFGKPFKFFGDYGNDTASKSFNYGGTIMTTTAISSLKFATNNGTSTFSGGQVLIYGVK